MTALKVTPGALLLDVGCGSGAVTLAAQQAVGIHGLVVGLDISLPMLRRASAGGAAHLVAGIFPGLPFRDACFNSVAASLVLSHVERYEVALRYMVRVLQPGGHLGVSAWAQSPKDRPNIAYQVWEETAVSFVGSEALREAITCAVPSERSFDPAHLGAALKNAGLEDIEVHQRGYDVTMPTDDYLAMVDLFAYGRFLRYHLGPGRWEEFRERVAATVAALGLKQIEYTTRYHIAVGTKCRLPRSFAPDLMGTRSS